MDCRKTNFSEIYGILSHLSMLQYLSGSGSLIQDGKDHYPMEWELTLLADGNHDLRLHISNALNIKHNSNGFVRELKITGTTNDGNFHIVSDSIVLHAIQSGIYLASSRSDLIIKKNNFPIKSIKAHILNFNPSFIPDDVEFNGKSFHFQRREKYGEILSAIEARQLHQGCFYTLESSIEDDRYEECLENIENVSWILSLTQLQSVAPVLIEGLDVEGVDCLYIISSFDGFRYERRDLLQQKSNSLSEFIRAVEPKVATFPKDSFHKSIHWITKAAQNDLMEVRWSNLILAFEYFLGFYLEVSCGLTPEEIRKKSIQQKLKKANDWLSFIPDIYLDDKLRKEIRNPLFHSGEIFSIPLGELIDLYYEFLDLLIRIVFRSMGYSGKYSSPAKQFRTSDV
ncbi:hypothetical protein LEP1GSC107_0003 [Leptospira interrogans serovar Grippotyphosa str. UI 12769]|nr:hypothetical protein [Leptospira interrogans]EKO86640.1 hypothetical protein LEP1GSC009_3597 [Leptospira interrogans serovar Grippotyphosa str. Andaman]EKP87346.1 hypothetical protein LEP1GSC020_2030 [Leptospira interrogans serovar Grippotyphosa str. 2006006986]EMN84872.1 hypothetical protein LEP1GSC107_0003 [Leptospira interrogans serovar Grippotyphosa str. UI 12769]